MSAGVALTVPGGYWGAMTERIKRVAILGATSHIAKGLICKFSLSADVELYLFARSPERVRAFLDSTGLHTRSIRLFPLADFASHSYDTVINCIGIGSPAKLQHDLLSVFQITQQFDDLVLGYLKRESATLYVNLSSGAAYGTDFTEPAGETTLARFNANCIDPSEYYGIAKLHCEAKHRSLIHYNIVDLRVFGYFSRFIDLGERFLLSEIVSCVKSGAELVTGPLDIWRDFVNPEDLVALIRCLMKQERINDVFDVYSAAPVGKFQIIDHFAGTGSLKYRVEGGYSSLNVTGAKSRYFSENRRAESVGYRPGLTSLQGIEQEVGAILAQGDETR